MNVLNRVHRLRFVDEFRRWVPDGFVALFFLSIISQQRKRKRKVRVPECLVLCWLVEKTLDIKSAVQVVVRVDFGDPRLIDFRRLKTFHRWKKGKQVRASKLFSINSVGIVSSVWLNEEFVRFSWLPQVDIWRLDNDSNASTEDKTSDQTNHSISRRSMTLLEVSIDHLTETISMKFPNSFCPWHNLSLERANVTNARFHRGPVGKTTNLSNAFDSRRVRCLKKLLVGFDWLK